MKRKFDIGQKVGRLTVLEYLHVDHAQKKIILCKCECGKLIKTRAHNIGRKTNSCGCLKAQLIRIRMGKPIEDVAARHVLNACKRNAETTISQELVKKLIFSPCFYCNKNPQEVGTEWKRGIPDGRSVKRVGIDRICPKDGYHQHNVVPCCQACNYIKRDHSVESLVKRLESFVENLRKLV